jgi:hypothetical protein
MTTARRLEWLLAGTVLALLIPGAAGAEYRLTVLADSADPQLGGVAGTVWSISEPTLSQNGAVAFRAHVDVGNAPPLPPAAVLVYTADDGGATAVTSPTGPVFPIGDVPGINAAGQVSFRAQLFDGATFLDADVRRADPGGAIVRVAGPPIFDGLDLAHHPSLDGSGNVFFVSRGAVRNGVYAGDGSETSFGDYTVIEENATGEPLPAFDPPVGVNEAGVAAYLRTQTSGVQQVVRAAGGAPEVIAQPGDSVSDQPGQIQFLGPYACLNASGDVAFVAVLDTPVLGVFIGDGTAIRTAADSRAGDFDVLGSVVGVNDAGQVAFRGERDGVARLFVGGGGALDEVVTEGAPFLDSVVNQIHAFSPALNEAGQVAFTLGLLNGRNVVVRADPLDPDAVPIPRPALWALALGLGAIGAAAARRMSRPLSGTRS